MKLLKKCNAANLPKFKFSLYREGLRQLRFGGIVTAVLIALVSVYEYLDNIHFNEESDYPLRYCLTQELPYVFDHNAWQVFFIASLFAVMASFALTSFTRSSKARDFYCAAPHSSGTLWLNFAAAALTWTAAGVLAFFLVSCAFLMPFDGKLIGACLFVSCSVLAAVFMVFGMAMLAISLTGRMLNALVNLAGLSALSTLVKIAFSQGYGAILREFSLVIPSSELYEYDPVHYIYKRLFFSYAPNGLNESDPMFAVFASWHTIGYCLLVGCVMLATAAVFMSIRTGDAAGRPFVNGAAHVLSLTVDYLPVAVLLGILIWKSVIYVLTYGFHWYVTSDTVIGILILLLFVFGSFWGIELLLTFDVRHAHRAFKLMPIPVLIPLVIITSGFLLYQAEFNTVPTSDEVESFTLVRNDELPERLVMFRLKDTFGRWITDEAAIKDRDIIEYAIADIQFLSDQYGYDLSDANSWINYSRSSFDQSIIRSKKTLIALRLNLKNGRSITRMIGFDAPHIKALQNAFLSDSEFMKKFLALPADDAVNVCVDQAYGLTSEETAAVYRSFLEEYNALPDEKKLEMIKASKDIDDYAEEDVFNDEAGTEIFDNEEAALASIADDIGLISSSKETGTYGIATSRYDAGTRNNFLYIDINGYPEDYLYEYQKQFHHSFPLSVATFPKTAALVVKTCNAKFSETQEHFIESAVNASKTENYYGRDDLTVRYAAHDKFLYVDFICLTGSQFDELQLYDEGSKAEYYRHNYGEDSIPDIAELVVDSDAMVRQLFRDIQATRTIDITKPYAIIHWHNHGVKGFPEEMTFYAQTESPLKYYDRSHAELEDSEE